MLNFLGLMGGGMPAGGAIGKEEEEKAAPPEIFDLGADAGAVLICEDLAGGPVFDLVKLKWLNGEYIRMLSEAGIL